jgi:hypothetical protein
VCATHVVEPLDVLLEEVVALGGSLQLLAGVAARRGHVAWRG